MSFINRARQGVLELPRSSRRVIPGNLDAGLRGRVAQIDHDQFSFAVLHPGPGDHILKARVIGPEDHAEVLRKSAMEKYKDNPYKLQKELDAIKKWLNDLA